MKIWTESPILVFAVVLLGLALAARIEAAGRVHRGFAAPRQQIAGELGIAERRAKIHRGHVTQKMEACSVAQLLPMAQTRASI